MEQADKDLIKHLYDLTDSEVFEAEKLYRKSEFSICGAARTIQRRREPEQQPSEAE